MKIIQTICRCGATYERAESDTVRCPTKASQHRCEMCGTALESSDPQHLVAYRLVMTAEDSLV